MRIAFRMAGAALILVGAVWFLQGMNVLPGSFMTGQTKWAVYGAITFMIGVACLVTARRRGV